MKEYSQNQKISYGLIEIFKNRIYYHIYIHIYDKNNQLKPVKKQPVCTSPKKIYKWKKKSP